MIVANDILYPFVGIDPTQSFALPPYLFPRRLCIAKRNRYKSDKAPT